MRAHVIVAALALIVGILYGVADKTDRGKGLNYPNLRGAAKFQALQP